MSNHNIRFPREIRKILCGYPSYLAVRKVGFILQVQESALSRMSLYVKFDPLVDTAKVSASKLGFFSVLAEPNNILFHCVSKYSINKHSLVSRPRWLVGCASD